MDSELKLLLMGFNDPGSPLSVLLGIPHLVRKFLGVYDKLTLHETMIRRETGSGTGIVHKEPPKNRY